MSRSSPRQEVAFGWRAKRVSQRGCLAKHEAQPGEDRLFSLCGVLGQDEARKMLWSQLSEG